MKNTGIALLALVALIGIAGTGAFAWLYYKAPSQSDVDAAERSAYRRGLSEGKSDAKNSATSCDVIVGGKANYWDSKTKPGDKVGMTLQIRSAKSGTIYEVQSPLICTVSDDLRSCTRDASYRDGATYPPGCK